MRLNARSSDPHAGFDAAARRRARDLGRLCRKVNSGQELTLDVGNVELRILPGDSVEIPHIEPALDALVVFAGSNDRMDWVRNLAVGKRDCASFGGKVHCGFESDFLRIREVLIARLEGFARVGIAGHSRAHPLACRLAEELHDRGVDVAFVVTFGGPRWCDASRRDRYAARRIPTHRFVAGWDAVPRWPKWGYRHVGEMVCLSSEGKRLKGQRRPAWWAPWRYLTEAVDDHGVGDAYADALREWAR